MAQEFLGKVVLVTGGASGIGRTCAVAFAAEGASVVVADRDIKGAAETARIIVATGSKAIAVEVNVADDLEVQAMMTATLKSYGRLDIAVNNAGIGGVRCSTVDYPADVWQRVIDVNLTGVFYCMKHELPLLEKHKGNIINVASLAGIKGFPLQSAYAAAKHGVLGLTKTTALEYVSKGVRINAVCPAFTDTPMVARLVEKEPKIGAKMEKIMPMGRLAHTEEIAGAILFLAGERAAYINGVTLPVDGGSSAL